MFCFEYGDIFLYCSTVFSMFSTLEQCKGKGGLCQAVAPAFSPFTQLTSTYIKFKFPRSHRYSLPVLPRRHTHCANSFFRFSLIVLIRSLRQQYCAILLNSGRTFGSALVGLYSSSYLAAKTTPPTSTNAFTLSHMTYLLSDSPYVAATVTSY